MAGKAESHMRLVIIESPYAGDIEANVEYARRCEERQWGIDAGLAWRKVAEASVVYTDRGISRGMEYGIAAAKEAGLRVEYRTIARRSRTPADNVNGDVA